MAKAARSKARRVIVVGAGAAGLMATLRLCEAGVAVDLLSSVPARRSPSVAAQAGINAASAEATDDEGDDSPDRHFEDTIASGRGLAHEPPVRSMCAAAPAIVELLARMGVPFQRTAEGKRARLRLGGSSAARAAYAGSAIGQQIVHALDGQVRAWEERPTADAKAGEARERMVERFEPWDLVRLVLDDNGTCVGVVAQHLRSMEMRSFVGDAVVLATGGLGYLFGHTTQSTLSTGSALAIAFKAGAIYANPELIALHPTAMVGLDKPRVVAESLRAEGARCWVPKNTSDKREPGFIAESERDYLLELEDSDAGDRTTWDRAARAIHRACVVEGRGIFNPLTGENERAVYLDLKRCDAEALRAKHDGVLQGYRRLCGGDPLSEPMRVFPAVHANLGGLWVDYDTSKRGLSMKKKSPRNHATNVPGLYAIGEVACQYDGANRLAGNGLLACLYGGMVAGPAVATYVGAMSRSAHDLPRSIFKAAADGAQEEVDGHRAQNQDDKDAESPYAIYDELSEQMMRSATLGRDNEELDALATTLGVLRERFGRSRCPDDSSYLNQSSVFMRHVANMLVLAEAIRTGARHRDESRGVHDKPAFNQPDPAFRKTTFVKHEDGKATVIDGFAYDNLGDPVTVTGAIDDRASRDGASDSEGVRDGD